MTNFVLSEQTLDVFKNLSRVSEQLAFRAGVEQRVVSVTGSVVVDVVLDSPIPRDCAIFDLPKLIGIIEATKAGSLPTLDFNESNLVIKGDYSSVTIPYANPLVIAQPSTAKFSMTDTFAEFELTQSLWSRIRKTAAILKAEAIEFRIEDRVFTLRVTNIDKNGGDSLGNGEFIIPSAAVTEDASKSVYSSYLFNLNNFELFPGDYKVILGNISSNSGSSNKVGAMFTLKNGPQLTYITAGTLNKAKK